MEPDSQSLPDYYGTNLPDVARKWSWGGFLLGWLWGVFNGVWISLLALIPFPGLALAISIYLGARGRELAWRSRQWPSPEAFDKTQRRWGIAGLVVIVSSVGLAVLAGVLMAFYAASHPDISFEAPISDIAMNVSTTLAPEATSGRDGQLLIKLPNGWDSQPWGESGVIAQSSRYAGHQTILVDRGANSVELDSKQWKVEKTENVMVAGRLATLTTYRDDTDGGSYYRYVLLISSSNGVELTAIADSDQAGWDNNQRTLRQSLMSIDY